MEIQNEVKASPILGLQGDEKDCSQRILKAFRFLEDVGEQVEALMSELDRQIKDINNVPNLDFQVKEFEFDDCPDSSTWLYRSVICTFEICERGRGKPTPPSVYAAYQVSLAPSRPEADDEFDPNLAIMLWKRANEDVCWECEEFELDRDALQEPYEDGEGVWKQREDHRWVLSSGSTSAVVFVTPLVKLNNQEDVSKVVKQLLDETRMLLVQTNEGEKAD